MEKRTFRFEERSVDYYFNGSMTTLKTLANQKTAIIITDENVFEAQKSKFKNWNTIVLKAGEAYKIQATVDAVIEQLIGFGADRQTTLVGIGGGVVTDLTGHIASIFMRGIPFGFVPTSLLSMVDAAIGGKNGIDVGPYKNMVGNIRQPHFILYDHSMLATLPETEWQNGFAEIIKHAAILDASMFRALAEHDLSYYQKKKTELAAIVRRNALLKTKVVQRDPYEQGERRILNFGHTLGHALENQYELSHGGAISIGMTFAAQVSEMLTGLRRHEKIPELLQQYGLPTEAAYDREKVIRVLRGDKKKAEDGIRFVLLERIGKAVVQPISFDQIESFL